MKKEYFKIIPASYLLLLKDNNILMIRRYNTGYRDGDYSLPAGHVEDGESAIEALIREIKEEINIDIEKTNIKFVHTVYRQKEDSNIDSTRIDFYFEVKEWGGDIKNNEPDKCDDILWFNIDDLPKNIVPVVKQAIENYKKEQYYSEALF